MWGRSGCAAAEHLLNPREGSGKVFHQLGRWKLLKEKNPDLITASAAAWHRKKASTFASAPTCRYYFWAANAAPSAGDDQLRRGDRSPVVDISFPEIEKFDLCRNRAPKGRPRLSPSWKAA